MKNMRISPVMFTIFSLAGALFLVLAAFFLSRFLPSEAWMADVSSDGSPGQSISRVVAATPLPHGSFFALIKTVIRVLLGLFSVLLTGVALWSGTLFVVHFDDEEMVTKARKLLIWSIIGVVAAASSYAIVAGVIDLNFGK